MKDRRACLGPLRETFERISSGFLDLLEEEAADKTVIAGDLVAFDEFGNAPDGFFHQVQLTWQRLDSNDGFLNWYPNARGSS